MRSKHVAIFYLFQVPLFNSSTTYSDEVKYDHANSLYFLRDNTVLPFARLRFQECRTCVVALLSRLLLASSFISDVIYYFNSWDRNRAFSIDT